MPDDAEFMQRLLAAFKIEADEHIAAISKGLLDLENQAAPDAQMPILETIYREAHSLKGAARAVNLSEIETLCQTLESVFAAWKRREISPPAAQFDVLHETVDTLAKILAAPTSGQLAAELPVLVQKLNDIKSGHTESRGAG